MDVKRIGSQSGVPLWINLRVLFMSGYAEFKSEDRGNLPPDALLLQKPFTRDVLLRQVAEALSASRVEISV